ncbi:MAG: hypothetical protein UY50_C0026G0009 [Parcubacteria group bacterium GW2011_GWA2_49_9]|nr:MAG: hypothetical protein UY50_C0026G0009 [Parcubacteria group bacterium GW2011_GWA2_49_9]
MAKFEIKIKAREQRRTGSSILGIAREFGIAKSTVSLWCRDILLTDGQKETLFKNRFWAGSKGRLMGAKANRQKRVKTIEESKAWAGSLLGAMSRRDLLITGIALYWAEGSKTDRRFIFVNSDPAMILVMYQWLKDVFGIQKEAFMPRISINEIHKPRIQKVLEFWSHLLELPVEQFGNPWFIKAKVNKVYDNYDTYYGILRLGMRNAAPFKCKMSALIELLSGIAKK